MHATKKEHTLRRTPGSVWDNAPNEKSYNTILRSGNSAFLELVLVYSLLLRWCFIGLFSGLAYPSFHPPQLAWYSTFFSNENHTIGKNFMLLEGGGGIKRIDLIFFGICICF